MIFAVRVSRLPSSGCWWKSRRQVTTCGVSSCVSLSTCACQRIGRLTRHKLAGPATRRTNAIHARRVFSCARFYDDNMLSDLRLGLRLLLRRPGRRAGGRAVARARHRRQHRHLQRAPLGRAQPAAVRATPDRLVIVWETSARQRRTLGRPRQFRRLAARDASFASLAAFDEFRPTLTGSDEPEVLRAVSASGTFFTTLGVSAAIGTDAAAVDDDAGADGSGGAERRAVATGLRRGARRHRPQHRRSTSRPHTVVGVMPARFESPLQTQRDRCLGERRSWRASHVPLSAATSPPSRLAPDLRRRAARAGRLARSRAAGADHADAGTCHAAIRRPTRASASTSERCTSKSSATCGGWSRCCSWPSA